VFSANFIIVFVENPDPQPVKTLHYRGDPAETAAGLNAKLWNSVVSTGVFSPNKISGVGTIFGLLVHVLPGPNKQRALQPSMLLS
jgi:hypothetical protein